jgi:cytidylate kinase
MSKITIAIDGFSSCGKSTLAKALAQKLHYSYIDTGAMYRCVTLYALRHGFIDEKQNIEERKLITVLPLINVDFIFNTQKRTSETYLNGENVEHEIRGMEVSNNVSKVSAIHEVREKMVALQREMGKNGAVILDGRDIGTNVFPKAELKIFMTADDDIRAKRRKDEYTAHGQYFTLDEVKQNLQKRDYADSHRKENPLTKAKDAIILDNTDLTPDQQLEFVLKLIADMQLTKDSVD